MSKLMEFIFLWTTLAVFTVIYFKYRLKQEKLPVLSPGDREVHEYLRELEAETDRLTVALLTLLEAKKTSAGPQSQSTASNLEKARHAMMLETRGWQQAHDAFFKRSQRLQKHPKEV